MKTRETSLEDFTSLYNHPSAILFRATELRAIYNSTRDIDFYQPSLDLGCGDGKIANLLFDEGFTFGIDNGEAKDVEDAVNSGFYSKVLLESAEKMSLEDEIVNFVFSNCVIEHIPDNEAVLSETSRILKRGGHFLFTVPSHNFPNYLYLTSKFASVGLGVLSRFYKYRRNKMLNHFHCHSEKDWKRKLEKYNFEIISYQYYMNKESLMLWDKMALKIFIKKFFDKGAAEKLMESYKDDLEQAYQTDSQIIDDQGAGLCIIAVKK